eukprot:CAMPEP_0204636354 /NCGR_PEP_ID=MMETSP0717-20131115/33689_1 /ASSEMBLY_ACC=CAM_ASM_000666 /TAXON_ID=230516 /ORGANISM="Chaetoceros curvisetus" /LENGTH=60 /DNA_ID=CAMNT_0051655375 /DNA_START=76 /DNA_END=254 /DNA_ORIENTATION=-
MPVVSRRGRHIHARGNMRMLRNFDLPEALIFYGMDTVVDVKTSPTSPTVRPGVTRLIEEA